MNQQLNSRIRPILSGREHQTGKNSGVRKVLFSSALLLAGMLCHGQNSEFKLHDNGLIYTNHAMGKLQHIVDSLNLKFKKCELYKPLQSKRQTKGHYLELEGNNAAEAKNALESGISYEAFCKQFTDAQRNENLLIVTYDYDNYNSQPMTQYSSVGFHDDGHRLEFESGKATPIGNWIYKFYGKTKYSEPMLQAFYLLSALQTAPLPKRYAQLVQYADCLVDTTAQVFKVSARESRANYYEATAKARKFNEYVELALQRPHFSRESYNALWDRDSLGTRAAGTKLPLGEEEKVRREARKRQAQADYKVFQEKFRQWTINRLSRVDSLKLADPNFMLLLREALAESKTTHATDNNFEEYVGRYISAEAELELKRNRRVMGSCSMDSGPRIHAFNIALLSAETTKWEIFLRSHLDIMNDRFDRVSDGSWATAGRQTYIRELEQLNIDVVDLLIGIALRVENPAGNHYFGDVGRIGRALAESKDALAIESEVLGMIADTQLDLYNRVLLYFLFDHYNYNLADATRKEQNAEKLKVAVLSLPNYVSASINRKP